MNKFISLALFVFAFSIVYLYRYDAVRPRYQYGDKIKISGTLQEEPQIYGNKQRISMAGLSFYAQRFPELHYGDKVEVVGKVEKKEDRFSLKDPLVKATQDESDESFLLTFRQKVSDSFGKFLPSQEGSLLKGFILSTKNSLDSDFYEDLRTTGTLHTVVASGSNVSLFAGTTIALLSSYISRRRSLLVGLLVVWFYVFLIGAQPPIVRAAVFATIGFVGQIFGRKVNTWWTLAAVAGIMLLVSPLWIFDLGFQLSFAATSGILLLGDWMDKKLDILEKIRLPKIMKQDLGTTLSAQVFVTPFIFFNFGTISLISPLVNMLILWTVSPLMIGGAIMGMVSVVWEPLAQLIAWLLYPLLWYFVTVVELFGQL
jgi:competence protein ComEC